MDWPTNLHLTICLSHATLRPNDVLECICATQPFSYWFKENAESAPRVNNVHMCTPTVIIFMWTSCYLRDLLSKINVSSCFSSQLSGKRASWESNTHERSRGLKSSKKGHITKKNIGTSVFVSNWAVLTFGLHAFSSGLVVFFRIYPWT